jgi:Ni/Fe-hydrogenase 1 B-type cytochrome subunit
MTELRSYPVWDAPTRWFHWINALCIVVLTALGLAILYSKALGIGNDGKVLLKSLHVWTGYLFAANLLWRIVWAFFGNRYARWRAFLPGGAGYWASVRSYVAAFLAGHPEQYAGHNPLARLGVASLLLLIVIQAITGLVLAGTDIFYPPFGHWIAQWVAAPGVDPATLVPYAPELVDAAAWERMRAFRKPFALVHLYGFYLLLAMVVAHVAAVVVTEVREGGSIVSAMFTGRKVLSGKPVDSPRRGD